MLQLSKLDVCRKAVVLRKRPMTMITAAGYKKLIVHIWTKWIWTVVYHVDILVSISIDQEFATIHLIKNYDSELRIEVQLL